MNRTIARILTTCGVATSSVSAQTNFPEIEPNETKAQATLVNNMVAGDTITGNSTGATAAAGPTSQDTFRVKTGPLPLGIYRHRLTITTTAGLEGHTGTIRGLSQSGGVPQSGTDVSLQSSSPFTTPARFNQWYGFGKSEEIYYRVTGSATTTADYTATLDSMQVSPTVLGTFQTGSITITTVGQTGANQTDTDLWVYDSNLAAIPNFGNDDEPFPGTTHGSTLTRNFNAGTYYLAISNFNLANNQPAASDDSFNSGAVTDFANAVVDSSSTGSAAGPLNCSFTITDSSTVAAPVSALKTGPFDILWFQFSVGTSTGCYANCDNSTAPPILNANDFQCFLNAFAVQSDYANCDHSTNPPVLNANDFQCFLNAFAVGCT